MAVTLSACQLQVLGYSHTVVEKSSADAESYLFCKRTEKGLPMIRFGEAKVMSMKGYYRTMSGYHRCLPGLSSSEDIIFFFC